MNLSAAMTIFLLTAGPANAQKSMRAASPASITFHGELIPLPNPNLGSEETAQLVLGYLAQNDIPSEEMGIRAAWSFLAPEVRTSIGGFEGFRQAMLSPAFLALTESEWIRLGPHLLTGDTARQLVAATRQGEDEQVFLLTFRLQGDGINAGCWLLQELRSIDSRIH